MKWPSREQWVILIPAITAAALGALLFVPGGSAVVPFVVVVAAIVHRQKRSK